MIDYFNKIDPNFINVYIKFFLERFLVNMVEIENEKDKSRRERDINNLLKAFNSLDENEELSISSIIKVADLINEESGISGIRNINVDPGEYATFTPIKPGLIRNDLMYLLYNYYHTNYDDIFLKEAEAHIKFMRIHPFEDGNKRCAKIILAHNLLKQNVAPVMITVEDTKQYYDFINNNDYYGFSEFLKQRSKIEHDTMIGLFKLEHNLDINDSPKLV